MFLVCIPTLSYEHELVFGVPLKRPRKTERQGRVVGGPKVDLRLKEARARTQLLTLDDDDELDDGAGPEDDLRADLAGRKYPRARGYTASGPRSKPPGFVPMETVDWETILGRRVQR